jgi:Excalibur calcium-binding domain
MRGIRRAGTFAVTAIASTTIGIIGTASVAGAHVCGDPDTYHNMPTPPGDTHNLDPDGDGIACEDPSVFHQPPPPPPPPPPSDTMAPSPSPSPTPTAAPMPAPAPPATPVVGEPDFTG